MTAQNPQRPTVEEPLLVDIDVPQPEGEEGLQLAPPNQQVALQEPPVAEPQPSERPCRRRLGHDESPAAAPQPQSLSARPRLGQERPVAGPPAGSPQAHERTGLLQAQTLMTAIRSEQNLTMGILAGAGAAVAGAIVWAIITVVTSFQIGWMAIGVGFLVGSAVRVAGKGVDKEFGYIGAGLALFGCLLGNLLSICAVIANQENLSTMTVLTHLNPAGIPELMALTFHPMDLLFYGLAIYAGYRFSVRNVTQEDVARLTASRVPQTG